MPKTLISEVPRRDRLARPIPVRKNRRANITLETRPRKGRKGEPRESSFDATVLERARALANQYRIQLRQLKKKGGANYVAHALEVPTARAAAYTPDDAVAEVRRQAVLIVAEMMDEGRKPPFPAGDARRSEQVNVRLTMEEKMMLEDCARQEGFRGLSDYVRAAVVAKLNQMR